MTNRYTASFFSAVGPYVTQQCSSKKRAMRAARIISAALEAAGCARTQVRVATPAGNLVAYIGR